MKLKTVILACITLLGTSASSRADSIVWKYAGSAPQARRIAACEDGTLYALHEDKTVWRNSAGGADAGWVQVGAFPQALSVLCAEDHLNVFNSDHTLTRDDGDPDHWTPLGTFAGTKEISGNASDGTPGYFSLSDDRSLWWYPPRTSPRWIRVGTADFASRIAAAGGHTLFALNHDATLWINRGTGDEFYWRYIQDAPLIQEIAAVNDRLIYALNRDGTLWAGVVSREVREVRVGQEALTRILTDILQIDQNQLHLDHFDGQFTPSGLLKAMGVRGAHFTLPTLTITGPAGIQVNAWIQNMDLRDVSGTIDGDHLAVNARFTERGHEIHADAPVSDFDIVHGGMNLDLGVRTNVTGDSELAAANIGFVGDLRGTGVGAKLWEFAIDKLTDWRGEVDQVLADELNRFLDRPETQAAFRRAMRDGAAISTGEQWQGVVFASVRFENGVLVYSVER